MSAWRRWTRCCASSPKAKSSTPTPSSSLLISSPSAPSTTCPPKNAPGPSYPLCRPSMPGRNWNADHGTGSKFPGLLGTALTNTTRVLTSTTVLSYQAAGAVVLRKSTQGLVRRDGGGAGRPPQRRRGQHAPQGHHRPPHAPLVQSRARTGSLDASRQQGGGPFWYRLSAISSSVGLTAHVWAAGGRPDEGRGDKHGVATGTAAAAAPQHEAGGRVGDGAPALPTQPQHQGSVLRPVLPVADPTRTRGRPAGQQAHHHLRVLLQSMRQKGPLSSSLGNRRALWCGATGNDRPNCLFWCSLTTPG